MTDIPKYDGTMDPQEHITTYTCAITGNDLEDDEIESVMLKKFGETLTKRAMQWYCMLPQYSIPSFELLTGAFVKAHAGARKVKARKADIFKICQQDDERLREFVTRFQRERILLPPVLDEWAAQAFAKGLNPRSSNASLKLKENLLEFRAITWADVHNRYESKIRVEDDQLGLPSGPINRIKNLDRLKRMLETKFQPSRDRYHPYSQPGRSTFRSNKGRSGPGPNTARSERRSDRCSGSRGLQFRNRSVGRSDTGENLRETSKRTEPEEPQHVINMIISGVEVPQGLMMKKMKFSIPREKRTRDYVPDGFISFSDKDVEGIIQPHNHALVISVLINKTHFKGILIYPGSSTNIIRWKVVKQLGLRHQIIPTTRVLNGFNMACETTKGEITLPVNAAGIVQYIKFYVIDGEMRYNALLGSPWLHIMRAVPSTLHQMLKFPTLEGVKNIHGEQPAAK
ncbi:uncharacterized protein LOC132630640 [Lycium barbarum]|uniref:uncharacterized protein LOC132630640 n=1 Tax=Lycium barbarum TaxID=112863 RepID=UPI00293EF1F1|nr:uncharacterized protein LOC132630640 [Lycium barbarum]